MARVPYTPVPDVAPQAPGEQFSVTTPGAAFGENIGAALKQLGGTTEQAGSELFSRAIALQELRNQTDAREAQTEYATESSKLHAQFNSLEGKAAVDGLDPYLAAQADLRKQIRSRLTSPMAQQHYDADSLPFMQRNVFSAAGHAADENKKYVTGTAVAGMEVAKQTIIDPMNQNEFDAKLDTLNHQIDVYAGAHDWDGPNDPRTVAYRNAQVSSLWMARVGKLALTDSLSARKMLEENQDKFTEQDLDRITKTVDNQVNVVGSKNLGEKIYSPDKTLDQMFKEVPDNVPDFIKGDQRTKFVHDTEMYLRTKVTYDRTANAQQRNQGINDIWGQIRTSSPTSLQELLAMPGMQAAFNSLPAKDQANVPTWINHWATTKDKLANDMEYNRLRGQSITDPQGFLGSDPSAWKVSPGQLVQLLDLRSRVTKHAEVDPMVQKSIGFMKRNYGSEMTALGIYNRDKANPDDYDHFVGALEEALTAHMQTHNGKPPSGPEMMEIGKDILKTHKAPGFFGMMLGGTDKPFYDVPQPVLDSVTADVRRVDPQATDQEIYRAALRQLFKELYAGSAGKSPAPAPGQ